MASKKTEELWLRVGITLQAPPSIIQKIRDEDGEALLSALSGKKGKLFIEGEAYIPYGCDENCVSEDKEFSFDRKEIKMQFLPERMQTRNNQER